MSDPLTINGKTVVVRALTADEWFDCVELEKVRDQDYALVAASVVDNDGKQVYSPADVGKLNVVDYAALYARVLKVNKPANTEKK